MPGHYNGPPPPKPKAPKNPFDEQKTSAAAGQKKRPTHYADGLDTGP